MARPIERIERIKVFPDAVRGAFRVDIHARVESPRRLRVTLGGAEAEALVSPDVPSATLDLVVPRPRLWSPDDPNLYELVASLDSGDQLTERVGLRSFEARDGKLWLNGLPFHMRGALDQAYWPDTLYTVPSDEEIEREIRLAKEMGLNLLRKHIKPEDPRYLDACNRLGMLIWAEPANPSRFTDTSRAAIRRDLFEMVERDFNQPCVVIWSLYNEDWGVPEIFGDPATQEWVADLYRELKAVDPTRPVCDNSGWAHVVTDLNDYHEYYAAPERIDRFAERMDFILRHPEENYVLGRAPLGGEPILVSEWGNWCLADPRLARERLGGKPAWFGYEGDAPVDRMKRVAGFEERFDQLGLQKQFGTPAGLCEHLQRRAFRALKAQIDEMRSRPGIEGYVVTELTDIEWEGNGWIDYWRQPKLFHEWLRDINGPIALIAKPERHGYWCGETVVARLHVQNTTAARLDGVVRWYLGDGEPAGEFAASIDPFASVALPDAIRFPAPDDPDRRRVPMEMELTVGGVTRARTRIDLAFASRASALVEGRRLGAVGLDRLFRQRLERHGYAMRGAWQEAPIIIATSLDEAVGEYLRAGGRVLHLNSNSSETFPLSPGESWRMAAGGAWADVERLSPAPISRELGYESQGIFPHNVLLTRPDDDVLVGWLEGWLANTGAFALLRTEGEGRLLATTFRFEDLYGLDPIATLLLNRLIAILLAD